MTIGDAHEAPAHEAQQHDVRAVYHQFFVQPLGVDPVLDPRWNGRLLAIADQDPTGPSLIVFTGCAMGPVRVILRAHTAAPRELADSLGEWEIGEEDAIRIEGPLYLSSPEPTEPAVEVYKPSRPGLHRVRVVARGRGSNYDLVVEQPVEEYEVTIWPTKASQAPLSLGDDGIRTPLSGQVSG